MEGGHSFSLSGCISEHGTEQTEQKIFSRRYICLIINEKKTYTTSYLETVSFKSLRIPSFALSITALSKESR